MKSEGRLNNDTVVATVMSNLGLERYLSDRGIKLIRTKVGDRFVTRKMLEGGYNLGGEQSGHIVFFDYNTTGDGPVTALHVLSLMKKRGLPLSALAGEIALYPQVLENIPVSHKDFKQVPEILTAIKRAGEELKDKGRILVRASGTEPKIRVMVEGESLKTIKRLARGMAKTIREKLS